MKRLKDMFVVLTIAAATAAVALALLAPERADATGQLSRAAMEIAQPKLTFGGCEFTLEVTQPGADAAAEGEKPTARLKVTNPGNAEAKATVRVSVTASEPASPMSRRLVMPRSIWSEECPVCLKPGESTTVALAEGVELPAGHNVTVIMTAEGQTPVSAVLAAGPPAVQLGGRLVNLGQLQQVQR